MGIFTNTTNYFGHIAYIASAIFFGWLIYTLISTLLIHGVSFLIPMTNKVQLILILFIATAISTFGFFNSQNVKIKKQEIILPKLEEPIKAAHLTDTHLGHFRGPKKLTEIVEKINKEKVDIVFFTGDLLDSTYQLKTESIQPLSLLEAPVYFVEGNHDEETGIDIIKKDLRSLGVNVLDNQKATFKDLEIIGLTYMPSDKESFNPHSDSNSSIKEEMVKINSSEDKTSILLHHGPNGTKYAAESGIDLYLTGHTHGGQMWPITYIAKAMFEYSKGLHKIKDMQIYVSQGTGTVGPAMRVGTYSELTILELKP